jgi:hypothetical protein
MLKNVGKCALISVLALVAALAWQSPAGRGDPLTRDPATEGSARLPNGKLQQQEILKADHEKSLKDAAQLIELAESLRQDLEKDDYQVLSISSLKKTDEIEKLAKRIRGRIRRY